MSFELEFEFGIANQCVSMLALLQEILLITVLLQYHCFE